MGVSIADEVQFASNPDLWPAWPQLPLVHEDGTLGRLHHPFLNSNNEVAPIVYLGSIFVPHNKDNSIQFSSLQAVFENGWSID